MSARNVIGEISRIHMGPKHPVITHSHIQCQYDCYPDTSEQLFPETWVAAFFVGHHFPASVISSSQLHELIFHYTNEDIKQLPRLVQGQMGTESLILAILHCQTIKSTRVPFLYEL